MAIFAPWLAPYDFNADRANGVVFGTQQGPSADHWFGTTVGGSIGVTNDVVSWEHTIKRTREIMHAASTIRKDLLFLCHGGPINTPEDANRVISATTCDGFVGASSLERMGVRTLGAFAALGWYSPKALLLYFLAYLVFVTVLRFADCFQHTYDSYPILGDTPIPNDKVRDRAYEQANTYSNVFGIDNFWLNLLWLNFGYHNAHHDRPTVAWHRLPAYHRELYGNGYCQVVPVSQLLKAFHQHRLTRVLSGDYGQVLDPTVRGRADGFVGAVGVSFLTAV